MSKIIDFPGKKIRLTRAYCECGSALQYWIGSDDASYGMCSRCNLGHSDEIDIHDDEVVEH